MNKKILLMCTQMCEYVYNFSIPDRAPIVQHGMFDQLTSEFGKTGMSVLLCF
jgi:hypothetical protein